MPIEITAKKDKFRRCGVAHSKEATTWPDGKWSPEEIKALKAEPMLMVREVPAAPEQDAAGKKETGKKKDS